MTQGQGDALHFYPPDHPVSGAARALIIKGGITWDDVSPGSQQDILSGVGQAFAEAERLFLFRLTDALTPYEPLDQLFAIEKSHVAEAKKATKTIDPEPKSVGPTVGSVAEHYLKAHKPSWAPKTFKSREVRIGYLVDFLGAKKILSSVTAADVRAFSEGLLKFRNRNTSHVGKCFLEKQTDNVAHRISDTGSLESQKRQGYF
ncbi:hypothetical protein [Asticcacaulis taihuensis]|uniref:hypothetical protein n=1 Tax=Asticcacaulis taihuensis TaxID=260084 RepID=UPI003F7B7328